MPEQKQRRPPVADPPRSPLEGGPSSPKVEKPDTDEILKKLRRVKPEAAKRFRQRSGE